MAMTVSASIQLVDMMTEPIQHINNVLNVMLAGLLNVDTVTDTAFNASQIESMQNELAEVDVQLAGIVEMTNREKKAQDEVNTSVQRGLPFFDNLKGKITAMAGAYLGMQGIRKTIDFYSESIEGANAQIEAERKLETVMRQRMGATEEQIEAIKQATADQQAIGVVGDEVQIGGAQQLSTFLNTEEALNTLIPAMNNLAVQQNGVNVTTENMVSIGNMMGKVMQGQTSALTRVGITFSEAQEEALKYGNEQERAATLAQVITDNVGQMNAAMAATPQGQIQQISNTWGDMKEVVGMQLYPTVLNLFNTINSFLPSVAPVLAGITTVVGGIVMVLVVLLGFVGKIGTFMADNWSIIGPIVYGIVTALAVYYGWMLLVGTATKIWSGIQVAFNAIMAMNPVMLIVLTIIALIAVIFAVCGAIAKFTGVANSGFGVICGCVNVVIQWFKNFGLEAANAGLGIWNALKAVANNLKSAFHNAISAAKGFFYDLMSTALTVIGNIAEKLNSLPFIEFDYSGIASAADEYAAKAAAEKDNKEEYESVSDAFNKGVNTFNPYQSGWASDAFQSGAAWGDGISEKLSGIFDGFDTPTFDMPASDMPDSDLSGLVSGTDETAKNTKAIADNTEKATSLLELVKDNWEKEAIMKYTSSAKTITYDLSGMTNTYNNTGEAFDAVKELGRYLNRKMSTSAEGV